MTGPLRNRAQRVVHPRPLRVRPAGTLTSHEVRHYRHEILGEEDVTVPAGTFAAIAIERTDLDDGDVKRYWFACGVGKVLERKILEDGSVGGSEEPRLTRKGGAGARTESGPRDRGPGRRGMRARTHRRRRPAGRRRRGGKAAAMTAATKTAAERHAARLRRHLRRGRTAGVFARDGPRRMGRILVEMATWRTVLASGLPISKPHAATFRHGAQERSPPSCASGRSGAGLAGEPPLRIAFDEVDLRAVSRTARDRMPVAPPATRACSARASRSRFRDLDCRAVRRQRPPRRQRRVREPHQRRAGGRRLPETRLREQPRRALPLGLRSRADGQRRAAGRRAARSLLGDLRRRGARGDRRSRRGGDGVGGRGDAADGDGYWAGGMATSSTTRRTAVWRSCPRGSIPAGTFDALPADADPLAWRGGRARAAALRRRARRRLLVRGVRRRSPVGAGRYGGRRARGAPGRVVGRDRRGVALDASAAVLRRRARRRGDRAARSPCSARRVHRTWLAPHGR